MYMFLCYAFTASSILSLAVVTSISSNWGNCGWYFGGALFASLLAIREAIVSTKKP
jgi:hypothetical protein